MMSLSKLKDLLCKGQHDVNPNHNSADKDQDKNDLNETKKLSETASKSSSSQYVVSVTVMKRRRTSPQVILKASITTVIVVTVAFIVLYTILLRYFTPNTVPYMPKEWEVVQNHHYRPKLIPRPMSDEYLKTPMKHRTVKWNISDFDLNKQVYNKQICKSKYQYLILIVSARKQFDRRNAIRNSWCRPHRYKLPSDAWRCVFLVGEASPDEQDHDVVNKHLEDEMIANSDILKGSYIDSYRNLTYKVLHGLHWACRSCPSEFVLKTDDDCYVNTHLLHILIMHHRDASNLYIGSVYKRQDRLKVIREPTSRWYVSREVYSEDYYPSYASGAGYLLSADVIDKLVDISKYFIPFPNEDAYIGTLAHETGISAVHSSRFTLMKAGWLLCNYLYLVVIHKVDPAEQESLLNKAMQANGNDQCSQNKNGFVYTWN